MTPQLATICSDLGITVVHPSKHRPHVPMHTAAENTLESILADYGGNHLRDVLTAITASENNKHMLIAPVIKAVSKIMVEHSTWYEESAGKFLEAMDRADLAKLHQQAKADRKIAQPQQAIATLLLEELRKEFRDVEQDSLLLWEAPMK